MPTLVASSVLVSVGDAKLPSAKIDEPTVTSPRVAVAPSLVYVVAFETITVALVLLGPAIVMVSPLMAETFPITLGWTMSILAAVLESVAPGMTRTSSPSARSDIETVLRSLVTVVEDEIVNVVAVPDGSVTVIEPLVRAVTTPPGPCAQTGPCGGDGFAVVSLALTVVW